VTTPSHPSIRGDLVLPGLVDGHMHLDKTLMGPPWMPHGAGPTRMSRIETDKVILPHLPVSTEERAGNLIEECVARGTAHLRTQCRRGPGKPPVKA
jgi:cytosine/creatinine deaminase